MALVIDQRSGEPRRVPSGNIGFGIRVDDVWDFIESEGEETGSAKAIPGHGYPGLIEAPSRPYPHPAYHPFPPGWGR